MVAVTSRALMAHLQASLVTGFGVYKNFLNGIFHHENVVQKYLSSIHPRNFVLCNAEREEAGLGEGRRMWRSQNVVEWRHKMEL